MNNQSLRFQSLGAKLLILSLLLLIIPSLVVGTTGWYIAKGQLNTNSQKMLKSEVNLVNATITESNGQVMAHKISLKTAQTDVKRMI